MTYHFTEKEKEKICILFKDGISLIELAKIFRCSRDPIGKLLIEILGLEKYTEIAKEHLKKVYQENGRKTGPINVKKMNAHPNTIAARPENGPENGRKTGPENLNNWKVEHPEELRELSRKNSQKTGAENFRKRWEKPTEAMIETCRENGRKTGPKNIKKLHEWNAIHHTWISRPEALFYITVLSKNFWLKDIIPQYFIKEINHRVDFAIPSQKLLFEVDGDYHHSRPGRKERDAEVDKWAKDNGWTIFRYNDAAMKKFGIIK